MEKPRLWHAMGLLGSTAVTYVATFVVSKVLALRFGPDGVGLAGAVLGLAALLASLILAGQLNNIPLWAAQHPGRSGDVSRLAVRSAVLLGIPSTLLACLVVLPFVDAADNIWLNAAGFGLLVLGNIVALQRPAILATLAGAPPASAFTTIYAVVMGALSATLVVAAPDAWLVLALGAGLAGGAIAGAVGTRRAVPRGSGPLKLRSVWRFMTSGFHGFLGTAVNSLVMGDLPFLILLLLGSYDAGLFRSAWAIAAAVWAFAVVVLKSIYLPRACLTANDPLALRALHAWTVRPVLIATTAASAAVAALAPFLLKFLYSPAFEQARLALALMAVATAFRTWTSVNSFFLFSLGRQKAFSGLETLSMVLLLTLVLGASRFESVDALAAGVLLAMLISAAVSEGVARKCGNGSHPVSRSVFLPAGN